jgi:chromosome segregation ATPase
MPSSSALLLLGAILALARASQVTPVEKVITLLEDLKKEVEVEGSKEASSYDDFACFCKKTTEEKAKMITSGQDNIEELSADIGAKTAEKADKAEELKKRQGRATELADELSATETRCEKEAAEYEAEAADLSKALSSLKNAIKAIGDSKPVALLQMRRSIDHALALAESMDLLSAPKQQAISNFIQEATGVDPSDPTYKFHSQGILDTLQKLLDEFTAEKADLDAEFAKSSAACKSTISDLKGKISKNDSAMEQLEKDIITLTKDIAKAREDLVNAEATLTDDQLYMKDLTKLCEERAKDWDQRTQLRAGELEALEGALKVLKDKVSPMDQAANERAMLMQKNQGQKMSLALRPKLQKAVSLLQNLEGESSFMAAVHKSDSAAAAKQRRAVALLKHAGNRLHSQTLAVVAMHVASDPFTKVKKLIQQLIERLLAEATAEATKKGFCDTELGKARKDRDYRFEEVKSLSVDLGSLEAKRDELKAEIAQLTEDLEDLDKSLKKATDVRKEDKKNNLQTLKDAESGLEAVTEAIAILSAFYKQSAKAQVFVQASPVDEDTQGPGFEGAYKGKQEASTGIIGMLEVIKSDFDRTIRHTTDAEAKAHADFVEFDRESRSDTSGKETKKKLDEEDLATTLTSIEQKMTDMQTAQDLLDSALKVIEGLKPTCIDTGMSYEERVAKREEEIKALKKALCILDPDGVEEECKD